MVAKSFIPINQTLKHYKLNRISYKRFKTQKKIFGAVMAVVVRPHKIEPTRSRYQKIPCSRAWSCSLISLDLTKNKNWIKYCEKFQRKAQTELYQRKKHLKLVFYEGKTDHPTTLERSEKPRRINRFTNFLERSERLGGRGSSTNYLERSDRLRNRDLVNLLLIAKLDAKKEVLLHQLTRVKRKR